MSVGQVRYIVSGILQNQEVLTEFLDWLKGGHIQALLDAGALSSEIDIVESDSIRVDIHYIFPDRATLQAYFDGPATALREDGKKRFIDTNKIVFSRSIATIDAVL